MQNVPPRPPPRPPFPLTPFPTPLYSSSPTSLGTCPICPVKKKPKWVLMNMVKGVEVKCNSQLCGRVISWW